MNLSHPQRLIHAAVGIIKRGDKLLLAERPIGKSYTGYWEFPGGKIEENESGADALKRELLEELGISVIAAKPWFEFTFCYPEKNVFLEMWLVEAFTGEPQGMEAQQIKWVTLAEMVQMPLLAGTWPIIERLSEIGIIHIT